MHTHFSQVLVGSAALLVGKVTQQNVRKWGGISGLRAHWRMDI